MTIEEEVLKGVKVRAARSGRGDSEVIEEMLRHELGLDVLEQLWASNRLSEKEALRLAIDAQHVSRRRRSR